MDTCLFLFSVSVSKYKSKSNDQLDDSNVKLNKSDLDNHIKKELSLDLSCKSKNCKVTHWLNKTSNTLNQVQSMEMDETSQSFNLPFSPFAISYSSNPSYKNLPSNMYSSFKEPQFGSLYLLASAAAYVSTELEKTKLP